MKQLVIAYIANGKSTNRYHLPYVLQRKDRFTVKKIPYLSVNIMILLAIIISAAGIITTLIQLSSLKEEKISSILKG